MESIFVEVSYKINKESYVSIFAINTMGVRDEGINILYDVLDTGFYPLGPLYATILRMGSSI